MVFIGLKSRFMSFCVQSMVTDCSVRHSYYRAYTIHNTFNLLLARNTAFDITGHAYYLESGVEENNRIEYNFVAFVHPINGQFRRTIGAFCYDGHKHGFRMLAFEFFMFNLIISIGRYT